MALVASKPKQEYRTHKGVVISITADWTGRQILVTAEGSTSGHTEPRSALVSRELTSDIWSIRFNKGQSHTIKLADTDFPYDVLINAAVRFVAVGNSPSQRQFDVMQEIRNVEDALTSRIMKAIGQMG